MMNNPAARLWHLLYPQSNFYMKPLSTQQQWEKAVGELLDEYRERNDNSTIR